jgi:MFS family permease
MRLLSEKRDLMLRAVGNRITSGDDTVIKLHSELPENSPGPFKTIAAATVGTVLEWYDFFLFGALASVVSTQFFAGFDEGVQFIFALLAFGVGFAFRPIGALIFGRIGDTKGRKYTFMLTLVITGGITFCVGLLPTYRVWGWWAPAILVVLRILQGIAVGGEYGGAAVFIAEHAPPRKRGAHTSWIQTTGVLAMVLALVVVFIARSISGDQFEAWGWRLPFLFSGVLLAVSLYIRSSTKESPLFLKLKAENRTSRAPIRETFGNWRNLRMVLIALFGLITGTTVVIYTGQVYSFFFLSHTLGVDTSHAAIYVAVPLLLSVPFFWFFGKLSDHIGRKPLVLTGCLLGALTYFPIYHGLTHFANPALETATANSPVTLVGDRASCSFQFDPIGNRKFTSECDRTKRFLIGAGAPYRFEDKKGESKFVVRIGRTELPASATQPVGDALRNAGYSPKADPERENGPMIMLLVFVMSLYLAMAFAPVAALLVEMFPTRIRLTALSFPYHLGNGIVGGFFPTVAFAIVAQTGDIYSGLWYPVIFTLVTVVVGGFFLRKDNFLEQDSVRTEDRIDITTAGRSL